ncbi:transposase [Paractinoplanes brasiliensis]|nr:transposase [Actinoplanes brasiliensis]
MADVKRLVQHVNRKIHLIGDRHPVHRRVEIRNWLAKTAPR